MQFAKARFAEDYGCVPVRFLEDTSSVSTSAAQPPVDTFVVRNARHPLLERTLRVKAQRARALLNRGEGSPDFAGT